MSWLARLAAALRVRKGASETDREIAFHLAERADDLVAGGMPPEAARDEARRRFGSYRLQESHARSRQPLLWVETVIADIRYGLRGLCAMPGFTLVAVLSLALGIGANTAIFTLINVAMLKALPVSDPEELVLLTLEDRQPSKGASRFTPAQWDRIRGLQDVFTGVFAYGSTGVELSSGGDTRPGAVGLVTGDFFATLAVQPARGRLLIASDDYRGCPGIAVVTHAFWQREYGARESVVGTTVDVNGRPLQIVGVADAAFLGIEYGYYAPIWAPQCAGTIIRGAGGYSAGGLVVGRLKDGVSLEQSRARMATLAPAILEGTRAGASIDVVPFSKGLPFLSTTYGEALLVLMGIVAVVLLLACANVANLLLARATARRREVAVRLSLGASRSRLIRQLLTESMLLALLGVAAGVLLARWGSEVLVGFLSRRGRVLPLDLTPDATVLLFTAGIGLVTGVLFGLAPAWRAVCVTPDVVMKPNGRGIADGSSRLSAGKALVVAQIALALVMITGAGLLVGSWHRLAATDPGFRSDGVLLAGVNTQPAHLPANRLGDTYRLALERLRAIPGVTIASAAGLTPFGNSSAQIALDVEGVTPRSDAGVNARLNYVSDAYFATLAIPLRAGRDFNSSDLASSPTVAIVSEGLARRFFGGAGAVGQRLRVRSGGGSSPPIEIVGIAADTKESSLREASPLIVYYALSQVMQPWPNMHFALRTDGDPAALVPGVRAALAEIGPRFSLDLRTLQQQVDESVKLPRTLGTLSGFFGALAVLLAAVGLFGLMSYSVARRRNEIGVRIALGAAETRVMRMVLAEVGRMAAAGIVIGVLLSLAVTRLVSRFLYGVDPGDPATLALSALTLMAVAIAAAVAPAWRAARLDPVAALRDD